MPNLSPDAFGDLYVGKPAVWCEDWSADVGAPCFVVWIHPDEWVEFPMLTKDGRARDADGDAAEYALVVVRSKAGGCWIGECPATAEIVVRLLRWNGDEASVREKFSLENVRAVLDSAVAYAKRAMAGMVSEHRLAGGA